MFQLSFAIFSLFWQVFGRGKRFFMNVLRKCFMRPKVFTAADECRSIVNQSVYFTTGKTGHHARSLSNGEVQ